MRATGCLCALVGALLALPAGVAEAKITPLPKPAGLSVKPGASDRGSVIAPVTRPASSPSIQPADKPAPRPARASTPGTPSTPVTPSAPRATTVRTASAGASPRLVPAAAAGGREQGWVPPSGGGRAESVPIAAVTIAPTPLGLAGAGESVPSYDHSWPSWMIPLLTLLAAAEGFVLVRLALGRIAQASEI
jgi:hypothetical protein